MPVEIVIFDCDGVLVDSEHLDDAAVRGTLREFGYDPDAIEREVFGKYFGQGGSDADMWKAIGDHIGGIPEDMISTFERIRDQALASVEPMAGVLEAVKDVRRIATVCVASSGSHEKMQITLGGTGLLPLFEGRVYSATQVEHGKPAPDLFLHAAAQASIDPEHCVVIEDSKTGVRAALSARMQVLGYCPNGDINGLGALGATVFTTHDQLFEMIKELQSR